MAIGRLQGRSQDGLAYVYAPHCSVGQPLSVIYCLGLPWVEVTGCNLKAKCPLAFGLVRPSLPGQWDALVTRISFYAYTSISLSC